MAAEDDLQTYVAAGITAIQGGDLATARIQLACAKATLALLPNITADGVSESYSQSVKALESAINDASAAVALNNKQNKLGRGRVLGV